MNEKMKELHRRAIRAREAGSRLEPDITVMATREDEPLDEYLDWLEAFFTADLADEVIALVEDHEQLTEALLSLFAQRAKLQASLERAQLRLDRAYALVSQPSLTTKEPSPRYVVRGAELFEILRPEEVS